MSTSSGTQSPDASTEQVTPNTPAPPPDGLRVTTRLLDSDHEPFPHTPLRDWVALLAQDVLGDGAFRLYCVSRSAVPDTKSEPGACAAVEISYDVYAAILGRSPRTIGRFADELFRLGLWEETEREQRRDRTPDGALVGTVVTVRVRDRPRAPGAHTGPVTVWDALARLRAVDPTPGRADEDHAGVGHEDDSVGEDVDRAAEGPRPWDTDPPGSDHPWAAARDEDEHDTWPGEREPAAPSASPDPVLAEELAMFGADAIVLVDQLHHRALALSGAQALTAEERVGLARRIDSRLAEGWSVNRVRSVLAAGSLTGIRVPGRLWMRRLDDMPAFRRYESTSAPRSRTAEGHTGLDRSGAARGTGRYRPTGHGRRANTAVNDCSVLPDPNLGKARYEIPDLQRHRMTAVWADDRSVPAWCGRCSCDSRCLTPATPGALLRPCPTCHPDPHAFPPEPTIASDHDEPDHDEPDHDGSDTAAPSAEKPDADEPGSARSVTHGSRGAAPEGTADTPASHREDHQ